MKFLRRIVLGGDPIDSQQARWEFLGALSLWSCLCLLIAAVVIARAAGASLFLSNYDGRELALVYVVVGLAVVAIIYGLSWLTHGVQYDRVAIGTIAILAVGTAAFRLAIPATLRGDRNWVFGAMYVFLETLVLVTTMQVWTLANSLFNSAQAKRLYVFIASGGIFGSILGGAATRSFAYLSTTNLLWIVVGLCPPMIVAIRVFRKQARHLRRVVVKDQLSLDHAQESLDHTNPFLWIRHPALRQRRVFRMASRLSLLAFLVTFTTNLIDFYFKTYADEQFHGDTLSLTQFFGSFYVLVGCVSLGMQVLITPLIVRNSSLFVGLALTPLVLSAGTLLNVLGAGLVRATFLKLCDSGFAHSVHRCCTEMLYTPLPSNVTGEIKLLAEGVAGRAGLVSSGLLLWILAYRFQPIHSLELISVLLVLWFVALALLKNTYRAVEPTPMANPISESAKRAA